MPELVSTLCTFLVLSPLVFTPGLGQFLFKPMAMAVAFAMIAAYFLSRTLVPACSAYWLKPHARPCPRRRTMATADRTSVPRTLRVRRNPRPSRSTETATSMPAGRAGCRRAFARWERMIDTGIAYYVKALDVVLRHRIMAAADRRTACWRSP